MHTVPTVKDFMVREIKTLSPDMSMTDAMDFLSGNGISGAPVVKASGADCKLVGVLTEKDCLRVLVNNTFYGIRVDNSTVGEYMTSELVTITPDKSLYYLANILLTHVFRRIPVVDKNHNLVGLVSRRDVIKASKYLIADDDRKKVKEYLTEEMKARLSKTRF